MLCSLYLSMILPEKNAWTKKHNQRHILCQTGAPFTPASFHWWGNLVLALLGVETVLQQPLPYFYSRHKRDTTALTPLLSQHGQKYLSVSFPHALPISFLSGHSDRLRECSSITSSNPLAFINSDHYELLSHRESKWGKGNVVFCSSQFKGTESRDRF